MLWVRGETCWSFLDNACVVATVCDLSLGREVVVKGGAMREGSAMIQRKHLTQLCDGVGGSDVRAA